MHTYLTPELWWQAGSATGAEEGGLKNKSQGDKKKKSPWREGKGPQQGGFKGKGGDKPGTGEAQRNKSFFEARKAGNAGKGQLGPKPGGMEKTICLCCRQRGHLSKHCPKNANQGASKQVAKFRCYNCGEEGHSIHACTKPKKEGGKLEFAVCFVCKQPGHISSQCPQNER